MSVGRFGSSVGLMVSGLLVGGVLTAAPAQADASVGAWAQLQPAFSAGDGSPDAAPADQQVYAASVADAGQSLPAGPASPASQGAFTGWFTAATGGTQVTDSTNLVDTFGQGPVSKTLYAHYAEPAPVGPTVDTTVSADKGKAAESVTSPTVRTSEPGELVVAYVQADGPQSPTQQVKKVTGGGLTWKLATRSNATWGTSEVWYAYAPNLFNGTVKAALRYAFDSSITVVAYQDAGTAPRTFAAGSGVSGTSSVTVPATKAGSLIVASAHNWSTDAAPVPADGQSLVHSFVDRRVHDTFWVQTTIRATSAGPVTLSATIPSGSRWTMAGVEIAAP